MRNELHGESFMEEMVRGVRYGRDRWYLPAGQQTKQGKFVCMSSFKHRGALKGVI